MTPPEHPLVEHLEEPAILLDARGTVLAINAAAGRELGWSGAQGRDFAELVAPDDRPALADALRPEAPSPGALHVRVRLGDGSTRECGLSAMRIRLSREPGLLLVARAPAPVPAAGDAGTGLLRMIVEQIPAILWTMDRDLRSTSSMGAGLAALGSRPGQTLGRTLQESLGTSDATDPALAAHLRALAGEAVTYEYTFHDRDYLTHVEPLRDREGEIVGVIGVALDNTERRRARQELERLVGERTAALSRANEDLRASEERFRAVAETAIDAVVSADAEGRIVHFNRSAERLFGWPAAEAVGRPLTLLMPERFHEDHRRGLERYLATGESRLLGRTIEVSGRRRDGSEFPLEISLAAWRSGGEAYFTGILRDISERRRHEAELRRAYRRLQRAQRELVRSEKLASAGMVMAGIAHEINNPLNVIYGNLKLMRTRTPAPVRAMVRDALAAAESARRIVEEFRRFAQDRGEAEDTDLRRCLEEAVEEVRPSCGRSVRIVRRFSRMPAARVSHGQIRRAVANLLRNAVESIVGRGTVSLSLARRGRKAVIEVADTGRGIGTEGLERVFEPFYTTKAEGRGFGLGLTLSQAIVQQHGGTIRVRSGEGKGTTVTILLPL